MFAMIAVISYSAQSAKTGHYLYWNLCLNNNFFTVQGGPVMYFNESHLRMLHSKSALLHPTIIPECHRHEFNRSSCLFLSRRDGAFTGLLTEITNSKAEGM